jgi:NADPH:quinone reductase
VKAISVAAPGAPDALEQVELPAPTPGPGEITIDVAYAGVGLVDVLFRQGAITLPMPLTPGIEVSGHVRAVGEAVDELSPGDLVAALLNDFVNLPGGGGYAEVARARAALAVPLPTGADLADAASVLVNGTTAWMAVKELARVGPDESVLVLGATGGLGGLVGQLARTAGAGRVIAAIGSATKREAAQRLGYTDVRTMEELTALPKDIDVAFDPVGGEARQLAFEALAPLGRMVILGNASGLDVDFAGDRIWLESKAVMGLNVGGIAHLHPERVAAAAKEVLAATASGRLDAKPAAVMPLAEAPEAHRLLEARKVTGKLVLATRPT